jgi:ribonucleoside-diphosphate reductase subunit M1
MPVTPSESDLIVQAFLDEQSAKAAEAAALDPDFAEAVRRQKQRQYENDKLMCSIENKEACLMCSG